MKNSRKKSCLSCFQVLSNATRVRLLKHLQTNKTTNVTNLTTVAHVTQPTVSHHMDILLRAGLVTKQQRGKEVFYAFNKQYPCHGCGVLRVPIKL